MAEIARKLPEVDVFVNVQGDEPEISAQAIDRAIELLQRLVGLLHDFLKPLPRSAPYTLWMIDVHPSSEPPKPSVRMTILFSTGL